MLGYLKARFSQLCSYLSALLNLLWSYRIIRWPLLLLERLWSFRLVRWPARIYLLSSIALHVIDMSLGGLADYGIIDGETIDNFLASKIEYLLPSPVSVPDFSSTNPFRELPDDPAVLSTIKESKFTKRWP